MSNRCIYTENRLKMKSILKTKLYFTSEAGTIASCKINVLSNAFENRVICQSFKGLTKADSQSYVMEKISASIENICGISIKKTTITINRSFFDKTKAGTVNVKLNNERKPFLFIVL